RIGVAEGSIADQVSSPARASVRWSMYRAGRRAGRTGPASADIDEDVVPLDPHRKGWMPQGRARLMLAVANVKLPAMPRAGDDRAAKGALAERSPLVRTDAIECIERAVDVEQGDDSPLGHKLAPRTG